MSMEDLVFLENNQALTNTVLVADKFGKKHYHVMDAVKNLINSHEKSGQFFVSVTYEDVSGKKNPMFVMNRDGFTLLVMGFTGKRALQFKMDYIEAFNKMEQQLRLQSAQPNGTFFIAPQEVLDMKNTIINQQARIIQLLDERIIYMSTGRQPSRPATRRRHKEGAPADDDQPQASFLTDYDNMSRFADEFFRNEDNFEHPISRLELWHRYLLFLNLTPKRSTVSCMFSKLRHVLNEYCRTHRIVVNPDVIYSCQSDFVNGYKRCSAYETAYEGNEPANPERRFLVRGARTFYFFHEGFIPKSCGDLRPATGKEGLMP